MQVKFQKTGERRYAVIIVREKQTDLEMNPAPGFDALMPHDLLHFIVEQEFKMKRGIFGQIALGGTAGTFHAKPTEKSGDRNDSRLRRKTAKRGKSLLKEGLDDCARSERATYVCLYDWFSHSAEEKLRARASEMKPTIESTFAQMSETERANFSAEKLSEIRARMNELSKKWFALKPDQALILEW